jgi:hypothetical protein
MKVFVECALFIRRVFSHAVNVFVSFSVRFLAWLLAQLLFAAAGGSM